MNVENSNIKYAIKLFIALIILIITLISSILIVRNIKNKEKNKQQIESVIELYSDDNVQERLPDEENTITKELLMQIDGENVIGVIKIDKINYEGIVCEGTSLDTLAKAVGHFENSPYFDGNVCLAAHNSNKFWAELHTLEIGDKITYVSFLGTRTYKVSSKEEISETDWSKLSSTNSNILTLITCVKNKPEYRLCVQAVEIK